VRDELHRRQLQLQWRRLPELTPTKATTTPMPIVGDRPTHGVRLRLLLGRTKTRYEGAATAPHAQWPVTATLAADGAVDVDTGAPGEVAEWIRRVVRIAARNAAAEGIAPPRVIQRWRADR
jgi:hypothetical protein